MQIGTTQAGEVIGWMEIHPSGEQIEINGRAYALSETKVDYTLQIERIGRSGKTATEQSGKVTIEAGTTAELSTTSVNIGSGDKMAILLRLTSGGEVVSISAIQLGAP